MNTQKDVLRDPRGLKEEILKKYPPKVAKKRSESMIINDPKLDQEIQSNVRTIPGIITQRGCTYAGCKGVVLGPTRDIINLVHGPIGCSFYAWLTRRNTDTKWAQNFGQSKPAGIRMRYCCPNVISSVRSAPPSTSTGGKQLSIHIRGEPR